MGAPGTTELEPGVVELVELKLSSSAKTDSTHDWLCAWCHHRVASERDRHRHEDYTEFAFRNPEGLVFHVITFSRTVGCHETGTPTLENTWFPGHAWSYCLCNGCRTHLGWYYAGPTRFVGLIRDRIVRAALIAN